MNTQTHMLVAATLFAKPGREHRTRNIAVLGAGLLPDLTIFVMFFWSKITKTPESVVWGQWYFNSQWQFWIDAFNSLPIYLLLLVAGVMGGKWGKNFADWGLVLVLFSLAAITHLAGDFFLHVEDAHAHFWPLSDWRYASAVSYWNPRYYGQYFSIIEVIAGILMAGILFKRFHGWPVRSALTLTIAIYVAVPIYFIFAHHGH